jgi:RNA polymerase sigma-70 factor (ECF subfamily)
LPELGQADEHLLIAAGRGDSEAFAELVNRHQAWAWRLAFRFLGEKQNAEDVVQEAFIRLLQAAPRFRPRAAFRTYFYRIITRLCLDLARKKRPIDTDDLPEAPDPAQDPASKFMNHEMSAAVRAALDKLPATQRMAVVLRYYDDLGYRDIAETMQISPKAVERLLSRARTRLQILLPGQK